MDFEDYETFERNFIRRFIKMRKSPYLLHGSSRAQRKKKESEKTTAATTPRTRPKSDTFVKKTCKITFLCKCLKCLRKINPDLIEEQNDEQFSLTMNLFEEESNQTLHKLVKQEEVNQLDINMFDDKICKLVIAGAEPTKKIELDTNGENEKLQWSDKKANVNDAEPGLDTDGENEKVEWSDKKANVNDAEPGLDTDEENEKDLHSAIPNDAMPEQSSKDIRVNEMTRDWIAELDVDHLMLSILGDKMHDEGSVISDLLQTDSALDILEHIEERHPKVTSDKAVNLDA